MKHVIYIDVLFILNLFINYILLLLGSKLMRSTQEKRWRMLLGALVGAVYSVLVFFTPNFSFFTSSFIKLIMSVVLVAVSYRIKTIRSFFKGVACFYCATFAFTGILIALWFAVKPQGMLMNNGVVYFDISSLTLIVSAVISYIGISLCTHFMRKMAPHNCMYQIAIEKDGKQITGTALMDTGNSLSDGFTETPVIVANYAWVSPLIPEQVRPCFSEGALCSGELKNTAGFPIRLIPSKTVTGTSLLPAFSPDKLILTQEKKRRTVDHVLVAVTGDAIGKGAYHALLHTSLWDE